MAAKICLNCEGRGEVAVMPAKDAYDFEKSFRWVSCGHCNGLGYIPIQPKTYNEKDNRKSNKRSNSEI